MSTEYKINLNLKDYLAIIFRGNKTCPICSNKVTRKCDKAVINKGLEIERQGHSIQIGEKNIHSVNIMYVCDICEKSYLPREFW